MRVLVTAASRHGATTEVAASVAAALGRAGLEVAVLAPSEVTTIDGFDAAVVGSGVYAGRWLAPAKDLLTQHREELARIPVWLFSSGPVGDPPKPAEDPVDVAAMVELVGARGHRVFPGLLDRRRLGLAEKAILAVVRAPEGDYRPWGGIDAWAGEIAAALEGSSVGAA
jgi:menaquinone-dependent protoporphyrinogen oxidase